MTDTVITGEGTATASLPLSPEELAPHFPQLEILECLGRGGMGVVYKARQKTLNRLVALKLLAPERIGDANFAQRFATEAQALARLNHPSIVTVYDFGQAGGFFYLLMEFVDGVNLRQLLRSRKLQPAEALAIVPPICEALQYAHEHGIVHRDIKPENLLLAKNGRAKIADFGIARILGPATASADNADAHIAGTPQYMAPEQAVTPAAADHRADIYSLGVVLYELLTGELPAEKLQPPSRKVVIDVRLDQIVLRALEKTPELRFQTAGELRTQVETVINDPRAEAARGDTRESSSRILKVGTSTLTTPEDLATFAGQLFLYRSRSHLVLDDRQLTFSRGGKITIIPLASIRDLTIGQYPRIMNPVGIDFISVTFTEEGRAKRLFFTPKDGLFGLPSEVNQGVAQWFAAVHKATTAVQGRPPGTVPDEQLGVPASSIGLLAALVVLLLPGALIALAVLRARQLDFRETLLLALLACGALIPFALALFGSRRKTHGANSALARPGHRTALVVAGFVLGIPLIWFLLVITYQLQSRRHPAAETAPEEAITPAALPIAAIEPPATGRRAFTDRPYTGNEYEQTASTDAPLTDTMELTRIRLRHAEREFERVSKLYQEKLVAESEVETARLELDVLRAQATGNTADVARIRLAHAERELNRLTKLRAEHLISAEIMDEARLAVTVLRAEVVGDKVAAASARLEHAEQELMRIRKLHEQRLVDDKTLSQAMYNLELCRAQLAALTK